MTEPRLLTKPRLGEICNGCGYCCSEEHCQLAREFLSCDVGPCVALEERGGRTICSLARNPLGYLFAAAHPGAAVPVLETAAAIEEGDRLSAEIGAALGLGRGCDADDDEHSRAWALTVSAQ